MSDYNNLLQDFKTDIEQEKQDVKIITELEKTYGDILTRNNKFCHLTSSVFIVNPEHTKILCIYHNIYNSWSWVGGHADGEKDLLYVAQKETKEETSLNSFKVLNNSQPISIEILPVKSHYKNGCYISPHLHLNFTFLFEADENQKIQIQEEENSNIGWLTFEEFLTESKEPHMIEVYEKIIKKVKNI